MPFANLLIVEDDAIIGRHIQASLKRMGYGVSGVLLSGEEAVDQACRLDPDLILMDISLAGDIDGVEAARQIRSQKNVPIIYLTAYADQQTLDRAKITDPFGYLLKPFDERLLRITIEMVLYKYRVERQMIESEEMLRTLVENQLEGVSITDTEGNFVFCNPAIETIFGVGHSQMVGQNICKFTSPEQNNYVQKQSQIRSQGKKSIYELEIIRSNGERRIISVMATPWIDKNGKYAGSFGIVNDITERKQIEASELRARILAEALRDTAAALNSSLDMDEVFDLILMNVGRVVPNDSACFMLIDGDQGQIVRTQMSQKPRDGGPLFDNILDLSRSEIFRIMRETRKPLVMPTVDWTKLRTPQSIIGQFQSFVGSPLCSNGQVIGIIILGSHSAGFYAEYHGRQLESFAHQATLAIENARLFMEVRKRAQFLAMLNEITRLSISMMDENQTIVAVAEKMASLYQADGAYITAWDEEHQLTIPSSSYGYTSEIYTSLTGQPGDLTLTASVLRAGRAIAVENIHDTTYIDPIVAQDFPLKSMMGLPLIADGNRLGAVIIGFRDRHVFTREEIENGEQISSQVALIIVKARLYSQVQRMAITDELTGLFNRRGIFEKGGLALVDAQKAEKPLALIWLDIDRFKEVNDTYGHHIGDQVVRGVAECCRVSVRDHDLIGRYGGEGGDELIVLLPETNAEGALQIAERLRERIAGQLIATDKGAIAVSVSLGFSMLSGKMADLNSLLSQADQAMYAAKFAGRNCVVVAEVG
jgi:diguanylate cyclase (GGDEF)-like protein/PAS domain S-box-containing protein